MNDNIKVWIFSKYQMNELRNLFQLERFCAEIKSISFMDNGSILITYLQWDEMTMPNNKSTAELKRKIFPFTPIKKNPPSDTMF